MGGGILLVVHHATHPLGETSQYVSSGLWVFVHVIGYVGWMSCLIGLIGLYFHVAEKAGRLVRAGFIMTVIGGTTLYSAILWVGAIVQPLLVSNSPALNDSLLSLSSILIPFLIGSLLFLVGYPLFGLGIYRSKTMQPWVIWPAVTSLIGPIIFLGGAAVYVLSNIGGVIIGLSLAAWGYAAWSEKGPSS